MQLVADLVEEGGVRVEALRVARIGRPEFRLDGARHHDVECPHRVAEEADLEADRPERRVEHGLWPCWAGAQASASPARALTLETAWASRSSPRTSATRARSCSSVAGSVSPTIAPRSAARTRKAWRSTPAMAAASTELAPPRYAISARSKRSSRRPRMDARARTTASCSPVSSAYSRISWTSSWVYRTVLAMAFIGRIVAPCGSDKMLIASPSARRAYHHRPDPGRSNLSESPTGDALQEPSP